MKRILAATGLVAVVATGALASVGSATTKVKPTPALARQIAQFHKLKAQLLSAERTLRQLTPW